MFFKVLINLLAATDFPSLCFDVFYINILYHIWFGLGRGSFKTFWKALVFLIPFLSFKRTSQVHFIKISMNYNKNQNSLLYLLVKCISAQKAPKLILSLQDEYSLHFSRFLIIGLRNFSANCWFDIIADLSRVTTPPKHHLLQNKYFFKSYFIGSCSSCQILKISISHIMLKAGFI